MNIKAVIFDLDDTVLNSKGAELDALEILKKGYKNLMEVNTKELREIWHNITIEFYNKYFAGEMTFEKQQEERMKALFARFDEDITYKEARKRFEKYQKLYKKSWKTFDDAIPLLKKLKKDYKLAIITNGDSKQQSRKIKKIGIRKYFDEIIISGEVGYSKPNKEIFEIASNRLNVKPEECIMIGDKLDIDIEGAEKAGMTAIWVNRKDENKEYKYTIKELSQLETYLNCDQ